MGISNLSINVSLKCFQVVKTPMDLGTIRQKIEDGVYVKKEEVTTDLMLVWDNAMTFNSAEHLIHKVRIIFKKRHISFCSFYRMLQAWGIKGNNSLKHWWIIKNKYLSFSHWLCIFVQRLSLWKVASRFFERCVLLFLYRLIEWCLVRFLLDIRCGMLDCSQTVILAQKVVKIRWDELLLQWLMKDAKSFYPSFMVLLKLPNNKCNDLLIDLLLVKLGAIVVSNRKKCLYSGCYLVGGHKQQDWPYFYDFSTQQVTTWAKLSCIGTF